MVVLSLAVSCGKNSDNKTTATSPTAAPNSSQVPISSEPTAPSADQTAEPSEPSIADTEYWITQQSSHSGYHYEYDTTSDGVTSHITGNGSYIISYPSDGEFRVENHIDERQKILGVTDIKVRSLYARTYGYVSTGLLKDLNSEQIKIAADDKGLYVITIPVATGRQYIMRVNTSSDNTDDPGTWQKQTSQTAITALTIGFNDQDIANRVAKAFKHDILLHGGVGGKEPF